MLTKTRMVKLAAITAAVAFPLSLTACTGGETPSSPATSSPPAASSAAPAPVESSVAPVEPSESPAASEPFGPGCSSVPATGEGSIDGMANDAVATATDNNPALNTLASAIKAAGLVDALNNAEDITVFAPTDDAFKAVSRKTLTSALADPRGRLTEILTMHVVSGRLSPDMLAGQHKTLNSSETLTVEGSGEDFIVNGDAKVVCGNVQTANATVYLVDQVLMPNS